MTGGKQLRPRLVLLAAELGTGVASGAAVHYARVVELLHAAGLCHDDLVDRSRTRRGRPTAWAVLGPKVAVVTRAWLVARAAETLAGAPQTVRRAVARSIRDVVRGQTDEAMDAFDDALSPEAYLRRAYAKTGALYELAGWLGAVAGRASRRDRAAVAHFAARTGVAFQLADDLRDLVGGALLGRERGTDLRMGVLTMPLLLTLSGRHRGRSRLRALLRAGRDDDVSEAVLALVRANGAFDASVRQLEDVLADARRALDDVRPSPARDGLLVVAREIVGPVASASASAPAPGGATGARIARPSAGLLAIDLAHVAPAIRRAGARAHAGAGGRTRALTACAMASTALLAVADDVGRARATTLALRVGLADVLLADLLASVAAMPSRRLVEALPRVSELFRAAVERAVADPTARVACGRTIDAFVDGFAAARLER